MESLLMLLIVVLMFVFFGKASFFNSKCVPLRVKSRPVRRQNSRLI